MKKASDYLIVNGVRFPAPDSELEIVHSQFVDAGRNLNGAVVGQKVGRKIWKINNLQWTGLDAQSWKEMKAALEPFYIPVTFSGDDGERHTVYMYPGDTTAVPLPTNSIFAERYKTCKFNLIDCGW